MAYVYNPIYHHFKGDRVTRAELIERMVTETILKSKVADENRAWSKTFELKHSSSVSKIGRILAQKRGLDEEIASIICVLHDIYVFETGRCTDHGSKGGPIAKKMLQRTGKFSEKEISQIVKAVKNHSDKHVYSNDPYVELVKDADVFDVSLFEGVHDAYVYEKAPKTCRQYFKRIHAVRDELGLPHDPQWDTIEMVGKEAKKYMEDKRTKKAV